MEKLIRLENVLEILDKKEGSWRNLIKKGEVPLPVYVGSKSPRWKESDLIDYINNPDPTHWIKKNAERGVKNEI